MRLQERRDEIRRRFEDILELDDLTAYEDDSFSHVEGRFDLVFSNLALHWANDLPGTLSRIRRALKPDGCFLASLFGGETLAELRQSLMAAELELTGGAAPRVIPFADLRDMGALLQRAGFSLPVVDGERIIVEYGTLEGLMHDLRDMGETNVLAQQSRAPLRRDVLRRAEEIYRERFATSDGRLEARFDIIYLIGWAPHESQQKPLPRGSGEIDLGDALKC